MSADDEDQNGYDENTDDQVDNDEIDGGEEGFLKGYDEADESDKSDSEDIKSDDEIEK
ncbi:MAG: hypothetical protein WC755_05015 [Candidatus Woesearchaeota archaeon]|jgi:hypothetical protein